METNDNTDHNDYYFNFSSTHGFFGIYGTKYTVKDNMVTVYGTISEGGMNIHNVLLVSVHIYHFRQITLYTSHSDNGKLIGMIVSNYNDKGFTFKKDLIDKWELEK